MSVAPHVRSLLTRPSLRGGESASTTLLSAVAREMFGWRADQSRTRRYSGRRSRTSAPTRSVHTSTESPLLRPRCRKRPPNSSQLLRGLVSDRPLIPSRSQPDPPPALAGGWFEIG